MSRIIAGAVSTPPVTADNLQQVVRQLKISIDSMIGQGDPLNRVVTNRDLAQLDIATILAEAAAGIPIGGSGSGGGGGTGTGDGYDPTLDATTPPPPGNLIAEGAYGTIILRWDATLPTYRNPSYTEVYGGEGTAFGSASLLGRSSSNFFAYRPPTSALRHFWVRHVSQANLTGPINRTEGTSASAAVDVVAVLAALSAQITASQLNVALGTRIDLIDAGAGVSGSVNQRIGTVSARLDTGGDVRSSIVAAQSTATAALDASDTNAADILTLQSQITDSDVGAISAALAVEASTRATQTGYLGSQYTVRTTLTSGGRTVVGGFGLSGTSSPGAGATIDFGVRADTFWIGPTNDGSAPGIDDIRPFVVRTAAVTENGVVIPKGVYIDSAYITNLTALWARIGTLFTDRLTTAQLNAANLTLGDGTVGGNLKSADYLPGSRGWALLRNGGAEFDFAYVRGKLLAAQVDAGFITAGMIDSRGLTIRDANNNPVLFAGSSVAQSTFLGNVLGQVAGTSASTLVANTNTALTERLQKSGADILIGPIQLASQSAIYVGTGNDGLYLGSTGIAGRKGGATTFSVDAAGNANFAGALNAATGTFAGSLTAATGTFSGLLTAQAIDAVDTINVRGEAIVAPRAVSSNVAVSLISESPETNQLLATPSVVIPTLPSGRSPQVVLMVDVVARCNNGVTMQIFLRRNGAAPFFGANVAPDFTSTTVNNGPFPVTSTRANAQNLRYVVIDQPGPGAHTYTMEVFTDNAGDETNKRSSIGQRSIVELVVK